ncbi:hypothetical protein ABIA70_002203 [Arthrobacter sp. 754]
MWRRSSNERGATLGMASKNSSPYGFTPAPMDFEPTAWSKVPGIERLGSFLGSSSGPLEGSGRGDDARRVTGPVCEPSLSRPGVMPCKVIQPALGASRKSYRTLTCAFLRRLYGTLLTSGGCTDVSAVFMVEHPSAASVGQAKPEYASIVRVIDDDDAACDDEVVVEDFNFLAAAEASPMGHIESHCCGRLSMVSSLLLHPWWAFLPGRS